MKRFLSIACLTLLAAWQFGCSKSDTPNPDPKPEPIKLNRDSVEFALYMPCYVAEAYRFVGKDSVDLMETDPLYKIYRDAAFLHFNTGSTYVNFYGGKPIPNIGMPGNSLTFLLGIRVDYPAGLRVYWDEEKGTVRVESEGGAARLPIVPPGKKAYLETSTFVHYRYLDGARNAKVKPRMIFIYEDDDPKLGKVKYRITLKPMYEYYRAPLQQNEAEFVVF